MEIADDKSCLKDCLELPRVLKARLENADKSYGSAQYGAAMNFMFDFVEMSMPYLSAILLEIVGDESPTAKTVVKKIDAKRPLSLGDWVNDLFTPLLIEARDKQPENEIVASLNDHLMSRKQNKLLGTKNDPSVVYLRNNYRGHTITLANEIYYDVCHQLMPLICMLAKAIRPISYMEETIVEGNHYMLSGQNVTMDLFPLVIAEDSETVYVYHTLKEESVSYLTTNPKIPPLITDKYNDAFDKRMQRFLPSFDISQQQNWLEICAVVNERSDEFLNRIYRQKKYNRELFVDRSVLSDALNEFLASDCALFPLIGDAGQGKTNQLCYWVETLHSEQLPVLILGSDEFATMTLADKMKSIFGYSKRKDISKLVADISQRADESDAEMLIIFDAINECCNYAGNTDKAALLLYTDICKQLLASGSRRLRVLFTCRTYTWKNMLLPFTASLIDEANVFGIGDEDKYKVRGFDDGEFGKAYGMYQALYQMGTDVKDIPLAIALRMHDPLVLKFVATGYLGQKLSQQSIDFTSIALYDKMWSDISNSYAGHRQSLILKLIGDHLLGAFMQGQSVESISIAALRAAYDDSALPLHKLAKMVFSGDGISIAYGELLNKSERQVLREVTFDGEEDSHIQFVYERFLEYVIARSIVGSTGNVIDKLQQLLAKGNASAVLLGAACNALIMHCMQQRDFTPLVALAEDDNNFNVSSLVNMAMDTLIVDNYEQELFEVERRLTTDSPGLTKEDVAEFNAALKLIEGNKADAGVIAKYNKLYARLHQTLNLRKLAIATVVNGVLLTDYFSRGLYSNDPLEFVWTLMVDDIIDVRNDTCIYIYYLSNRTHTRQHTFLAENLSERVVDSMFGLIYERYLLTNMASSRLRKRTLSFIENGIRLTVILIIDALMRDGDNDRATRLFGYIIRMISYFTWKFALVKMAMPFFQIVMRKQITFQSDYCNNAIEYSNYWNDSHITLTADSDDKWTRMHVDKAMDFLPHYRLHHKDTMSDAAKNESEQFVAMHPAIMDAYHKGDSFSYFVLERIMVIMGVTEWQNVAPIARQFFGEEYRGDQWYDYSQMSMLYVLYQIAVHSNGNDEILDIYARECRNWTCRCRGRYKAPLSDKANRLGLYKRNLINWYAEVYCAGGTDGKARPGDNRCVPMAYELIDEAFASRDKELLWHLMDCITEMVTDNRLINTALDLVKHILGKFENEEIIREFNDITVAREGIYTKTFVQLMSDFLSTAKNYFPIEINNFLRRDIIDIKCPAISAFREDILNFNPANETLSDLLTHKFGNFLMWSLLNHEQIGNFAVEAMKSAPRAKDCVGWYNEVVKKIFRYMFNVKL